MNPPRVLARRFERCCVRWEVEPGLWSTVHGFTSNVLGTLQRGGTWRREEPIPISFFLKHHDELQACLCSFGAPAEVSIVEFFNALPFQRLS